MVSKEDSDDKVPLKQPQDEPEQQSRAAQIKAKFKDLTEKVSGSMGSAKEEYEHSDVKRYLDKLSAETKRFLDEHGITEHVSKAYDTTQEQLDVVSGSKILRLVEERLELQEKYNDVLATKLSEALQRIELLEARLKQRDQK